MFSEHVLTRYYKKRSSTSCCRRSRTFNFPTKEIYLAPSCRSACFTQSISNVGDPLLSRFVCRFAYVGSNNLTEIASVLLSLNQSGRPVLTLRRTE